jgi:thiol-disulfide isomerase/thioredoxin
MTGVVTAIVALLAATIVGVVWRRRSGVLRPTTRAIAGARGASAADLPPLTGAPDIAGASDAPDISDAAAAPVRGPEIGPEFAPRLGERATLVQFSSAFCAPCRSTRRVLDEVAAMVDGVTYVEIDAESRLDLVRRLGVLRTPTVLVLDGAGRIVRRGTGLPRKADVIAALGAAVPGPAGEPSEEAAQEPSQGAR